LEERHHLVISSGIISRYTIYDEINDSSVDESLWVSDKSMSEDTNKLSITVGQNDDGYVETNVSNGDFKIDITVITRISLTTTGGTTNNHRRLQIWNGSAIVTIESETNNAIAITGTYILSFDNTNNQVFVWKDGTMLDNSPF